jgi:hypothetical protein
MSTLGQAQIDIEQEVIALLGKADGLRIEEEEIVVTRRKALHAKRRVRACGSDHQSRS